MKSGLMSFEYTNVVCKCFITIYEYIKIEYWKLPIPNIYLRYRFGLVKSINAYCCVDLALTAYEFTKVTW